MNQSNSFVRKVIYITLIGLLLAPISMVSRPASLSSGNSGGDGGGELSQLRSKYELAQDQLSQIDPTSETMKLASLGMRGIAVNLLWGQANEQKKKQQWDQLEATLNMLIKIQPNFVKVWEFQAHNLAYNVSMEFDDYEYRYHWVKKGIRFLTTGIGYNIRDHRIKDHLGFFTGMKIGTSDEKNQFRRMFRVDGDFHEEMAKFIEPASYEVRDIGHDNWKMAYQWYDQSRKMVDSGTQKYSNDWMFYMRRPAQLRNMGLGLQEDFRSDETIRAIWDQANREWVDYGNTLLEVGASTKITLEGIAEAEEKLERLRSQMDELVPGVRQEFLQVLKADLTLTDFQREALEASADQRTDVQQMSVRDIEQKLAENNSQIDTEVAKRALEKDRMAVKQIHDQIIDTLATISAIDRNQGTSNYRFWKILSDAESGERAVEAHQKMFDATEKQRQSIFEDEYQVDSKTKEKIIINKGAISYFDESFKVWNEVMQKHPQLQFGKLADDIVDVLKEYQNMLKVTGLKWPRNHPLQPFIDSRATVESERDDLPTTAVIAEIYAEEEQDSPDSQKKDK